MQLNTVMRHLCPNFRLPEKGKIMVISNPKRFKIFPILADLTVQKVFKSNRLAITSGDLPPCTEAERQEAHATHLELLANLWHSQNILHSIAYVEMRMNLLQILLALYRDVSDFQAANAVYADATSEITAYKKNTPHDTPSENRKAIQSVENWFSLLFTYSEFVPAAAFDEAAIYNSGIQIISNYSRLLNKQPKSVAAAFRVIHGASLESVATKYKLKQSDVRTQTLYIGQILYRIGFVTTDWDNIKPAETIPQLRTKEYTELANLDTLKALASKAEHEFCLPFEDKFGVTQTNWAKFRQETQRGFTQISKLLNNKQSEEKWDCNVIFRQPENVLRNPKNLLRNCPNFVTKPDFCVTKPA